MVAINDFGIGFMKSQIIKNVKARRLAGNFSRKTLSERSGVPESTIKRFETIGEISLDGLLRISMALGCIDDFDKLFAKVESFKSLEEFGKTERRRGRK